MTDQTDTEKELNETSDAEATVVDDMAKQVNDDAVDVQDNEDRPVTGDELDAELEAAKAQASEYLNRLQHLQADFQNYKKRKEKEQAEVFTMIEDRLLGEFLPLYDDLNRAFEVYAQDQKKDILIDGLERIFAKFKDFLDTKEIQVIEAAGQKFDPNLHEVLMSVEADQPPNTILDEYERGYTRQGRLLRASRVTVSKRPAEPVNEADAQTAASLENEQENDKDSE